MTTTTLAEQIIALCEKIRATSKYDSYRISDAIAVLVGAPSDTREFYSAVVSIHGGLLKLAQEMGSDKNFAPISEYNTPQVAALPSFFLITSMNSVWAGARSAFENAYQPLKTFAAFQKAYNSGINIDMKAINILISELQQLQKFTTESDLPEDLKQFALKQIAALISALSLAAFVPIDALWDNTFMIYGRLVRRKNEFEHAEGAEGQGTEEETRTIFSRISDIANRTLSVCDAVHKAGEVVDAVGAVAGKFLPVS